MANSGTFILSQYSCVCLFLFDDYCTFVCCGFMANLGTFKFSKFCCVLTVNLSTFALSE